MTEETRTILLVEDHPLYVDGFTSMLRENRPGWTLLSAHDCAGARALLQSRAVIALAIVDLRLPDGSGMALAQEQRLARPELPVMIVSGREDALARAQAYDAGARAYAPKTASAEQLLATMDLLLAGGSEAGGPAPVSDAPELTGRQMQVLSLLAEGCANKEIRHRLGIAERTVRAHLTELFVTLGVSSRMQALLRARACGLIE